MTKGVFPLSAAFGVILAIVPGRAIADPVVTSSGSISAKENTPIDFSISSLATSTDPITGYTIDAGPLDGSLTPGGPLGDFTYTPNNYFFGSDAFRFFATDSLGDVSNVSIVSITVNKINLPPLVSVGVFGTTIDTPLEIALSGLASPTNGVPIVSYAVSTPGDGTIPVFDPSSGILFYDPNTGFLGVDQFFWTATAANGLKAESVVDISVNLASVTSVPEPSSVLLLCVLCAAMAIAVRKLKRA